MSSFQNLGHVVTTDVLVLGGGLGGLWSAIEARKHVDNVLIVDKGPLNWGGIGNMSGGDMIVCLPEDDVDKWVDDLVYYFDGLIEQDVIEDLMQRSYKRFLDYEEMGHIFARDDQGRLKRVKQRGLDHVSSLLSRPFGMGGKSLVSVLTERADKLGIRQLSRVLVTNILKDRDRIAGVAGFHTRSGEFYTIRARSIVIATGNSNWKTSYGSNTSTGEGFSVALDAGVRMRNFEYIKVWNMPKDFSWEGQTILLPLGARFVNGAGDDFMQRYSPKMGAKMDPHYNTRAFIEEYLAGRGPIYFDTSCMSDENVELLTPTAGWMGINYRRLKEMGMDFFKSKLEWIPQPHYTQGGIDADIEGATSVDGIFAAGRARNLEPGLYLGGWAISGTATTGSIAGESAGRYAAAREYETKIDEVELSQIKKQALSPLSGKGISPKEILNEIRKVMAPYDVSILKSKTGLIRSLNRLNEIRNELIPRMAVESPHYLMKAHEIAGMAAVTELYLQGSLMRNETRGGHHRVEHPEHDEKYLGWFLVTKQAGKLQWDYRPVPLDRYKIRPYRFYSDLYKSPNG